MPRHNVNLSSFDEQESFFTSAVVGLTYEFGNARTKLSLTGNAGFTYYWDTDSEFTDNSEDYDLNLSLGFNITHRATPRLTLSASVYASYQTQPSFDTFNNVTFSVSNQNQDFFYTINRFSAGYAWTPRFSTLTSYSLGAVFYQDDAIANYENRLEHTFGNEFRFLVAPTTTAVFDYRFGLIDYTDDSNRDSFSNYFLAGLDHSFSPRFNVSFRAGVEIRNFDGNVGGEEDRVAPYGELTLTYALAQATSITWANRVGLGQPDSPESYSAMSYRTSLGVRHNFTSRISAGLNFAYQYDNNYGSFGISGFDQQYFDLSIGVRYAINRNWALDAGYQHTQVVSDESLLRDYSRNRFYGGATFTF